MSVYYENGELSRIVFHEPKQKPLRQYLYDVGTHIVFPKDLSRSERISVAVA